MEVFRAISEAEKLLGTLIFLHKSGGSRGNFRAMRDKLARRMAEDEITCACDALVASDALAALTEIQCQILAGHGITPDTAAFLSYCQMMFAMLTGRVRALHAGKLAGAN